MARVNHGGRVGDRAGVHGYHVYKDIWEAPMGKEVICKRETRKDRYAVAVKNFACKNICGASLTANTAKTSPQLI